MDEATFDAYVAANPPGTPTRGLYGNPQVGQNSGRDPFSIGGRDPYGQQANPAMVANQGAQWWEDFFNRGPGSVQLPQFQIGNQDQARAEQQRVIQALQAQAAGDPNSLAQQQLGQAYQGAQSQQSSLGSTMRGQSAGAAMRGIQAGQQGIQRSLPGDQQMLMLQEQQAAQAMLAQLLAQQQGQDITQATGMANTQLQGQQLDEAMKQFYAQQGLNAGIAREQTGWDRLVAGLGYDLETSKLVQDSINKGLQTGAAALNTAAQAWGGGGSPSPQQTIDDAFNG
jgi:hypothetical protein